MMVLNYHKALEYVFYSYNTQIQIHKLYYYSITSDHIFHFVVVEMTKPTKNIWQMGFENVIILGFLMADTSSKQLLMHV